MTEPRRAMPWLLLAAATWLVVLSAHAADATGAGRKSFHLAAGDAALTLRTFSAQSGEQIVYPVQVVRGIRTRPVDGEFTPRQALERMVAGTALRVVQDSATGALSLTRARAESAPPKPGVFAPWLRPPPIATGSPGPAEELVRLSPFEVRGDPSNSYQAYDSNTLTSFRVERDKMPATSLVFTRTFMDDVAATSVQDVLFNYSGTVGPDPNNGGAALAMPGDRDTSGALGIRGLTANAPKRDGFIGMNSLFRSVSGYNDNFSVERVEVIEGPQSVLYGAVGGGGVINVVSKRAAFGVNQAQVQTRFDQYGSRRAVADVNAAGHRFALRVAAAGEQRRSVRYNLGNEFYGLYLQTAVQLGPTTTLRVFGERDANWANVPYTPSATELNNFLPVGDRRRGQDVRYLAMTGQLADLRGSVWNGPMDWQHISSFAGWWSSERIDTRLTGFTVDTELGRGWSAQAGAIYSETIDDRFTVSKSLVPAAGLSGAGSNPYRGTAVRFAPGDNWQSDRTRGVRATLLHEATIHVGGVTAHAQTAFGFQASHQGPAFGSSGIDRLYYQADANWNVIVNRAVTLDYGRIPLGNLYIPIQNGLPLRPVFRPGARQVTLNGQNYVLEPRIRQDSAAVSPSNPAGLVPNNPTPTNPDNYAGNWNRGGETHDRQVFVANFTDWADGAFTTVAGVSVDRFETLNIKPGAAATYLAPRNYPGFQAGVTYRLRSVAGLRAYAVVGTAGLAAGTTKDLHGANLRVPRTASAWPEVGLKYESPDGRWSAQLACDPRTAVAHETQRAGVDFLNAVNPNGINGRYNAGDQWINVDRKSSAIELSVTAAPSPNWRFRLNATKLDGQVTSTVVYRQLYNDQFFARGGVVTYRDGTPVVVDPAGANGVATTPLSLAMINDPAGAYYAAPDTDSGRITNPTLIAALTAVDPVHGSAATGVSGLPLSAMQYEFANPHQGEITVVSAGDKTTGINEYAMNCQANYEVRAGALRGLGLFADVRTYWRNRAFYTSYFPAAGSGSAFQARRELYRLPTTAWCGVGVSYKVRVPATGGRATWTTRLNVENVFDASRVWVMPSPANGATLNARLSSLPRTFIWSNTITF